jgi:hypothetical protein
MALQAIEKINAAENRLLDPCRQPSGWRSILEPQDRRLDLWKTEGVNKRVDPVLIKNADGEMVAIDPSTWLRNHRAIDQITWAPGRPQLIEGQLIVEGGWIDKPNARVFNSYRQPTLETGDPTKAQPWLDHIAMLYPNGKDHIVRWIAYKTQFPGDKINHGLVLGGSQGIGKDTLLEPLRRTVGHWNFADISPIQAMGRFNKFARSVILRISEARDLGEKKFDRYAFYEHTKGFMAAPPDVQMIDEKYLGEYYVPNCVGTIITTNHKFDGVYLPSDDRRHYVEWSELTKENFTEQYWNDLWGFYENGGYAHITAYLRQLDLSAWNAKAPPPKTEAFWVIVNAQRSSEDSELVDVLEKLGNPNVVMLRQIIHEASGDGFGEFAEWLSDRKNRTIIPKAMDRCGYEPVRNPNADDGRWMVVGRRETVYVRKGLVLREQLVAVRNLIEVLEKQAKTQSQPTDAKSNVTAFRPKREED